MNRRTSLLALALLVLASPAWAVKEWYDHYLDARDRLIPRGQCTEAVESLKQAIRLKPSPALNEQTYGLQFVDYHPYYYMGLCYLKLGDFNSAERYFNIEEDRAVVKKSDLYRELVKRRTEAQDAEHQRVVRLVRQEADRLVKEAQDLAKGRKFADALARLAQAQVAAATLDPQTQRTILEMQNRIRADEKEVLEAAARAQRIEEALAEGRRLLDAGAPTEAIVRFDEVLALDPRNDRALDGKREAQDRILASKTKETLEAAFREGKALFDAGEYEKAIRPLTDAAADPAHADARDLLQKAQKILAGLRAQREQRLKIDGLIAEGDALLQARKFPEALVKFQDALALDPGQVRAKERLAFAESRTGDALFEKWLPNQTPTLTFFEPRGLELDVEGSTVAVVGVATDDRGIAKVEFRSGGRLVAAQSPPSVLDFGESVRNFRFERKLPLDPGPNEIGVVAVDSQGVQRQETFRLNRRLRFYETKAFLPSALGAAVGLIGLGFAVQRARRRRALRERFNPYIAGAPVMKAEMFFGRQKLMARMLNVIHHNSLMITGERRIGKTTFLYHLKHALENDDGTEYRFFPVLTDLQGVPESGFFHTLMADAVETLKPSTETLASLRFRPDEDAYDGRDFSHDLQRVVEELKTRTPKHVKLALLIDEVDALNEYSERINQRLRSIFMKTFSEQLVAIMSGVGIKRSWKSEVSPWYNFFDEIELTAFSRDEAEALIRTPVEGVFRFESAAVESILEHSELKPYLVQKFCIHAVNRMLEDGRTTITAEDVEAVRDAVRIEGPEDETGAATAGDRAPAGTVAD